MRRISFLLIKIYFGFTSKWHRNDITGVDKPWQRYERWSERFESEQCSTSGKLLTSCVIKQVQPTMHHSIELKPRGRSQRKRYPQLIDFLWIFNAVTGFSFPSSSLQQRRVLKCQEQYEENITRRGGCRFLCLQREDFCSPILPAWSYLSCNNGNELHLLQITATWRGPYASSFRSAREIREPICIQLENHTLPPGSGAKLYPRCLNSLVGRKPLLPTWYGRRREQRTVVRILKRLSCSGQENGGQEYILLIFPFYISWKRGLQSNTIFAAPP